MKKSPAQSLRQARAPIPVYPFILGVYPLLALLTSNIGQVRLTEGLRAGLASLVFCALLYLVCSRILRSAQRGALLSAVILVLFFSYGHVYGWLEGAYPAIGRHRYLAPLWAALLAGGVYGTMRLRKVPAELTPILNLAAAALVVLPLFSLVRFQVNAASMRQESQATLAVSNGQAGLASAEKPDIYYIILDGYTREDVLREYYDFDNSAFLDELRSLGFVIPDCAKSNYGWTPLSLSSALQMEYLSSLDTRTQVGNEHLDYMLYEDYIQHSPVRRNLEELGYHTLAFDTGYPYTTLSDATTFLVPTQRAVLNITEFEVLYLRTTALRVLSEGGSAFLEPLLRQVQTPEEGMYTRVNFMLDTLDNLDDIAAPRFVFAHIPAPHTPFVFTAEGDFKVLSADEGGYTSAITYLNWRVLQIVRRIIETSTVPPIIIIQGDHGWTMDARLDILNAYYLPGEGSQALYPGITPVNTFRLIFNQYFEGNYPYLEDVSYFSPDDRRLQLSIDPATCVPGEAP